VHEVRDHESDQRLEDDRAHGKDHRLLDDHPECFALEQELEVAEPDKVLHRLVQRREVQREDSRVQHERSDDDEQRQRHQEADRRAALRELAQPRPPAVYRHAGCAAYRCVHEAGRLARALRRA
jgi:hypothetical protein